MDRLAPSYQFLIHVRFALENGLSVRMAIEKELELGHDEFHSEVRRWFVSHIQGQPLVPGQVTRNFYRQSLLQVLAQGLRGASIHSTLLDLETEWEKAVHDDIERHLQRLPVIVLMPLVFLQFPAFLTLLLGPLLADLMARLSV